MRIELHADGGHTEDGFHVGAGASPATTEYWLDFLWGAGTYAECMTRGFAIR